MSADPTPSLDPQPAGHPAEPGHGSRPEPGPEPGRRPPSAPRVGHLVLTLFLWFLGLLALAGIGLAWYAGTPSFENRVRHAVIARLQDATGGRVTLGHFGFQLTHLEFDIENLTIHGKEAPGQLPYAHLDRLYVRLQLLSFFRPAIALNYLEADHPVVHLIVYPDGTTNAPQPRHPSTGNAKDELFRLKVGRTVLNNGVAVFNEQRIPFNLAASDLGAQISYLPSSRHYAAALHAEDITAQRGRDLPVHSVLDASLDIGRNSARLISLNLQSGPRGAKQRTVVRLAGTLDDFSDPRFQFTAQGAVDALEIRALTGTPGLGGGIAQIDASGHGTRSDFSIDGTARVSGGTYDIGTVHIAGVTAQAIAHVTQNVIALRDIRARVGGAGLVTAGLSITNWEPSADGRPAAAPQHGVIDARVGGFSIDRILDQVSPPGYRRLGFDSTASGTAHMEWTGSIENFLGTVNAALSPQAPLVPGEIPLTGEVAATYVQKTGTVLVHNIDLHTPASQIHIDGDLGVYPPTRPSHLAVSVHTSDLSEFDQLFHTVGLSREKLAAQVHGQLRLTASVYGNLMDPGVNGHLEAANLEVTPALVTPALVTGHLAAQPIHLDSLTAQVNLNSGLFAVDSATLVEGRSRVQLSGEVRSPDKAAGLFSPLSTIHGRLSIQNASLVQAIALTGRHLPVTGTVNLEAQTGGTLGDLNGEGRLAVQGGAIDGDPYKALTGNLRFQGRSFGLDNLVFSMDGGTLTGNAGYDLAGRSASFNLEGNGFDLSRMPRLQNAKYPIRGTLSFAAKGGGTLQDPSLDAQLHLRNLSLAKESTGSLDLQAHTRGRVLTTTLEAHLNVATLDLASEVRLEGDYQSRSTLRIAKLDIDPLLRTFSVSGIRGNSSISSLLTVSGPLNQPKRLRGDLRVSDLNVDLEDVPLHSIGDIHATLADGTLHLDPLRIVGTDTDLHAQGTIGVFDQAKDMRLRAAGGVNMTLLQTLDPRVLSSGHVDFNVDASGTTSSPDLTGNVRFSNVNVALEDYINGLSRMNGSLVFDQNRLDFQDVTAYSGGGLIRLGGFVTYRSGLFADLTATAKGVRIRYPQGVTATADAKVTVQGTTASSFISGNLTITGFAISPDIDFASLSSTANGVSLPPNPDSPANQVRLDIRIHSAPSLDFQNSFAKLAGNVSLAVRGTLAQPTVLGRVTITEGSATFNGARFQLQHGTIYFSNPVRIQPIIDLTATTTVEDYNISISLQGTTDKLNPTFRSEPPLSEQDIFSLLAMGRTQEEQQIYNTEEAQAGVNSTADSLLGGALNATLSSRVQKLFGGGSVRIDPTFVGGLGNATARITITEPVSKQATLTYATNVNSTAEQLIQAEWRVTQDFSVLAVRDEAGVFSLIFRLRRRYY